MKTLHHRYKLHDTLGQGGMGIVYRATDRLTGEIVALKQVTETSQLHLFVTHAGDTTDKALRRSLAHEFQTLAGLRHPHIISVLDYGFDEIGNPFFTMDYLPGAQTILEASQGAPDKDKVILLQQLLLATAYLHRQGILHRDIKPENVLVVDGVVRVLDFGLAASREGTSGSSGGTPLYAAPEL